MARLAQMEMELEKLRQQAARKPRAKVQKKAPRRADDEDDEEEEEEEEEDEEEEEEEEEEVERPPPRKRAKQPRGARAYMAERARAAKRAPVAAASSEPTVDFFDALMSSQFGRR